MLSTLGDEIKYNQTKQTPSDHLLVCMKCIEISVLVGNQRRVQFRIRPHSITLLDYNAKGLTRNTILSSLVCLVSTVISRVAIQVEDQTIEYLSSEAVIVWTCH